MRALIVDDNENAANALAAYLSLQAIKSYFALGGRQALDVGAPWRSDVILMDISMPETSGVEAAFVLRQDWCAGGTIILAFTAFDEAEVLRHLTELIIDGYCQKGQSP